MGNGSVGDKDGSRALEEKTSTTDAAVLAVKHQEMARSTSSATASVHFVRLAELRSNLIHESGDALEDPRGSECRIVLASDRYV